MVIQRSSLLQLSPYQYNFLKVGLYLNIKKTKILSTEKLNDFTLGDENFEIVQNFNFLGSNIEVDSACQNGIKRRLGLGRSAMMGLSKIRKDKNIKNPQRLELLTPLFFLL